MQICIYRFPVLVNASRIPIIILKQKLFMSQNYCHFKSCQVVIIWLMSTLLLWPRLCKRRRTNQNVKNICSESDDFFGSWYNKGPIHIIHIIQTSQTIHLLKQLLLLVLYHEIIFPTISLWGQGVNNYTNWLLILYSMYPYTIVPMHLYFIDSYCWFYYWQIYVYNINDIFII